MGNNAHNYNKLLSERERKHIHCLNLECKSEQLKVLIKKLNSLSCQRGTFSNTNLNNLFFQNSKSVYITNCCINEELEKVLEQKEALENNILKLKRQMLVLDNEIKLLK